MTSSSFIYLRNSCLGRLGTGSSANTCTPVQVEIPDNYKPSQAFCGLDCSVILTVDGSMLCCGSNRSVTSETVGPRHTLIRNATANKFDHDAA